MSTGFGYEYVLILPYRVRFIQLYTVAHITGPQRDPIMENAISLLEKILPDLIAGIQKEIHRKTVKNGIRSERAHKIFYYIIRLGGPPPTNPACSRAGRSAQAFTTPLRVY
jgi:hypothetical protein